MSTPVFLHGVVSQLLILFKQALHLFDNLFIILDPYALKMIPGGVDYRY